MNIYLIITLLIQYAFVQYFLEDDMDIEKVLIFLLVELTLYIYLTKVGINPNIALIISLIIGELCFTCHKIKKEKY